MNNVATLPTPQRWTIAEIRPITFDDPQGRPFKQTCYFIRANKKSTTEFQEIWNASNKTSADTMNTVIFPNNEYIKGEDGNWKVAGKNFQKMFGEAFGPDKQCKEIIACYVEVPCAPHVRYWARDNASTGVKAGDVVTELDEHNNRVQKVFHTFRVSVLQNEDGSLKEDPIARMRSGLRRGLAKDTHALVDVSKTAASPSKTEDELLKEQEAKELLENITSSDSTGGGAGGGNTVIE